MERQNIATPDPSSDVVIPPRYYHSLVLWHGPARHQMNKTVA
jgi:hypothetical protein